MREHALPKPLFTKFFLIKSVGVPDPHYERYTKEASTDVLLCSIFEARYGSTPTFTPFSDRRLCRDRGRQDGELAGSSHSAFRRA